MCVDKDSQIMKECAMIVAKPNTVKLVVIQTSVINVSKHLLPVKLENAPVMMKPM